jgi:undecaprenyl phosphate-alpha-L-ara4FN deformylase
MKIGLRIDVDTYRGTKLGVPALCALLAKHSISATFFFSVGPDNMGRNLWRLLRPVFLWKMLRTKAASLYGWDILLRGTFGPGPIIGKKFAAVKKDTAVAGHEIGFHAWDHYSWQAYIDKMDAAAVRDSLNKGIALLEECAGCKATCSAAPGWRCTNTVLQVKDEFDFVYNSDCRGSHIFYPVVDDKKLSQPQIPVTLPTYDEVVGKSDITDDNYNEYILSLLKPDKLNVLTIHAEVEGILHGKMFDEFIKLANGKGYEFIPLCELLPDLSDIEGCEVVQQEIAGREGRIAVLSE